MNNLCADIGWKSINHEGEQLCGDHVDIVNQGENSQVVVLADGLGSGVKASILSTLTSKIISTMMAAGLKLEDCVSTIAATLPICSVRGVAYSTFTILHIIENRTVEIIQYDNPKPYIDAVITFEELQALFDSRDIDITTLGEDVFDNASYFGRIFARSGGLSDAVAQGLKEQNIDFALKAVACDGIEECRTALLKKSKNVLDANFIEGMACLGGCIGGAGCLTHGEKNKTEVDKYGREALEKTISDAVAVLK